MKSTFARLAAVALALLLTTGVSFAAQTSCPEHYAGGVAPDLINQRLKSGTIKELCNSGYATLHSSVTKSGLYAAEHLTAARINQARTMERTNKFHAEPRIPARDRAELRDYQRSGFDRGHIAPSGDMPDAVSQEESFSLANMVPQNPSNNRITWEGIESTVRKLTLKRGELFAVTGSTYQGTVDQLNGRVLVPSHLYKAVYDPQQDAAAAYLVENSADSQIKVISIAELIRFTGVDPFPKLSADKKASALRLPIPRPRGRKGGSYE